MLDTSIVTLTFISYEAEILEDFLIPFQSKAPTCHLFYSSVNDLVYRLMDNFLKKRCITNKEGNITTKKALEELAVVNIKNTNNHLDLNKVHFGTAVKKLTAAIEVSIKIDVLKQTFLQVYIVLITAIQEKMPLKNETLKNLQFLHPGLKTKSGAADGIKNLALIIGKCLKNTKITRGYTNNQYVDKFFSEFQIFQVDSNINFGDKEQLDTFWDRIQDITAFNGENSINIYHSLQKHA